MYLHVFVCLCLYALVLNCYFSQGNHFIVIWMSCKLLLKAKKIIEGRAVKNNPISPEEAPVSVIPYPIPRFHPFLPLVILHYRSFPCHQSLSSSSFPPAYRYTRVHLHPWKYPPADSSISASASKILMADHTVYSCWQIFSAPTLLLIPSSPFYFPGKSQRQLDLSAAFETISQTLILHFLLSLGFGKSLAFNISYGS